MKVYAKIDYFLMIKSKNLQKVAWNNYAVHGRVVGYIV